MQDTDLEFLQSQTKILRGVTLPPPWKQKSALGFVAIAQDMDQINHNHVFEGQIQVAKWQEADQEEVWKALETAFGAKAASQAAEHVKLLKGQVLIKNPCQGAHHTTHENTATTMANVLNHPDNKQKLVVLTIEESWKTAVLLEVLRIITQTAQGD
jgi:L-fucose isomerase-like protein